MAEKAKALFVSEECHQSIKTFAVKEKISLKDLVEKLLILGKIEYVKTTRQKES